MSVKVQPVLMYGNDDNNETVQIEKTPGSYVVMQLVGPNGAPAKGVLFRTTSNRALRQWWDRYCQDYGKFYKLVRHTYQGEPVEMQMSDDESVPVPLPYTDHSDASVPTVPKGTEVPR